MMKRLNQADDKYPFLNTSFYLDIRNNPVLRGKLCMGINALKGVSLVYISCLNLMFPNLLPIYCRLLKYFLVKMLNTS